MRGRLLALCIATAGVVGSTRAYADPSPGEIQAARELFGKAGFSLEKAIPTPGLLTLLPASIL